VSWRVSLRAKIRSVPRSANAPPSIDSSAAPILSDQIRRIVISVDRFERDFYRVIRSRIDEKI
jgi:hypothetical protein